MRFRIIGSLLISVFFLFDFFKNYKTTKNHTNFFLKYSDLIFAIQWILIALMNFVNYVLLVLIIIISIIIQVMVSRAIRNNNKAGKS